VEARLSNWLLKAPKEPKEASMAVASSPVGLPPLDGPITLQNSAWLTYPPPALRRGPRSASGTVSSLVSTASMPSAARPASASASLAMAALVLAV